MPPSLYVCFAIRSIPISNGTINKLEIQLRGAENQVEITERIKLAKIIPAAFQQPVIRSPKDFGSTERVFDRLSKKPGECEAEKLVSDQVKETHRLFFHRIDEPATVCKIAFAVS